MGLGHPRVDASSADTRMSGSKLGRKMKKTWRSAADRAIERVSEERVAFDG
jgi:hypothetical protein